MSWNNLKGTLRKIFYNLLGHIYPKALCSYLYYRTFQKKLNWKNPQTLNEWVCWLEYYSDTSLWTVLADKYRVRDWLANKGLDKYLPKLYGVYTNVNQINFEALPNKFVLKSNNGCGQVMLIKDKSDIDYKQVKKQIKKWLKTTFGYETAEPHYIPIPKCIIAEELLENMDGSSLVDYKWHCFNGQPKLAQVTTNRKYVNNKYTYNLGIYDDSWNRHDEYLNKVSLICDVAKPRLLDKQLEICRIISAGFPQIRVDLYEVNGKVYIGELTMTSAGGKDTDITPECDYFLGQSVDRSVIKYK